MKETYRKLLHIFTVLCLLCCSNLAFAQNSAPPMKSSGNPPEITLSPSAVGFNCVFIGNTYTQTVNVKAKNLRGDITLNGMTTGEVELSTTTITKSEAESSEGYNLTITLTPTDENIYQETVVFNTQDADMVTLSIFWAVMPTTDVADIATLKAQPTDDYTYYKYTGEAIVTAVDGKYIYMQDATGGLAVNDSFGDFPTVKQGDKITGFVVNTTSYFGAINAQPAQGTGIEVLAENQTVEPVVTTLSDLKTNAKTLHAQLVKVDNVTFTKNAGETFNADMINPSINDGTADGTFNIFESIYGTTVPTEPVSIVGVSTSASAAVVGARTADDITKAEVPEPTLTLSKKMIYYNYVFAGETYTETINVKATNLSGDLTIEGLNSGEVTVSATTIPKAEAESEAGYDLTVTLKPTKEDAYMETFTFNDNGKELGKVTMYWTLMMTTDVADIATLKAKPTDDYTNYKYTGEAIVTAVDAKYVYMQDATGGLAVNDNYGDFPTVKQGDKITGFIVNTTSYFGAINALPVQGSSLKVLAENQTVEPVVTTLADLKTNAKTLHAQLVKVDNVTFTKNAGETFNADMINPSINDGTADGTFNIFESIYGTTVPTEPVSIIGVSTSASAAVVGARTADDFITAVTGEPALNITEEVLFEGTAAPINVATEYVKLKVEAANLPSAVSIYITGTNNKMFSLSTEEIPAGTSTTDVIVTYTPTAVGKHTARINFESADMPELNTAFTLNTVCIDPANPPTIIVEPMELPEFSAKVGEQQQQTLKVTTKGLPDYGKVKIMGEGEGAFLINNTMLMKEMEQTLTVTFKPKAEGTFTERLEFSALEAETFYVTITGTTSGGADPGDKEGDDLPLTAENPLTLLNENFDNITNNKPISIEGWKNVAMEGKRAWWGSDADGEKTAKVTAYDSNVEIGKATPCEMLLVTPPLDFVNSKTKMFTFRVMGNLLTEGMTDLLELCYIDLEGGEMNVFPVELTMPNIADLNNEWQEYHLNLEGQDLADVFFMGFRFKSQLGRENSAIYYIDDVTYGRDDLPMITPSVTQLAFESTKGATTVSEEITLETLNTTEPITLSLGGPNKSNFELTVTELPATGGKFAVKFQSDEIGVHEAYVKVSSRGAADVYIPVSVNNKDNSGIVSITFEASPDVTVYDLSGRAVKTVMECKNLRQATDGIVAGTYILKAVSKAGVQTTKVMVP